MTHLDPRLAAQADITTFWRTRMEPSGFGAPALWMTTIQDESPSGNLVEISDLPAAPTQEDVGGLAALLAHITAEDSGPRIAMLLARPGGGGPTDGDRAWAAALIEAARRAGARCEPVHLATDETLDVIPVEACRAGSVGGT